MVYNKDGESISDIYNVSGYVIETAYDVDGNEISGGLTPPDRHKSAYSYENDPDPDKSYTWNYTLADLVTAQNGNFTIGIQTDTHFDNEMKMYATPLKNMTKQLYFDFIVNLGDVPRGYENDSVETTEAEIEEMLDRYMSYVESPVLVVMGNHDNATMATGFIPKSDMHGYYIGNNSTLGKIKNPTGELYYYKDFYECRVIVLDTNNYPYIEETNTDININHHTISEEQITWFKTKALHTNKPVLVLSHNILVTDVYPEKWIVPDSDTATAYMIPYRANKIVEALNDFVQSGGVVVACLSGHIHEQKSAKVNGINYIAFKNGGAFAEILFVDFANRAISTKAINSNSILDRTFTF